MYLRGRHNFAKYPSSLDLIARVVVVPFIIEYIVVPASLVAEPIVGVFAGCLIIVGVVLPTLALYLDS